jgi:hypothetical protein
MRIARKAQAGTEQSSDPGLAPARYRDGTIVDAARRLER